MKRKVVDDSRQLEDSRRSKLLFNKSRDLIEKIKISEEFDYEDDYKPVWVDDDDEQLKKPFINLQYTEKLKQKYEMLIGTPNWAKLGNKKYEEIEDDNEIMRTVGHTQKKNTVTLQKGFLEMKYLHIINYETRNEGSQISCVEFHPKLSVTLVAGNSGSISLFSIGGDNYDVLHKFKLKSWKITSAQFTPSGTEAILASNYSNSYCVYDLIKAQPKLTDLPEVLRRPKIFEVSRDGNYIASSKGFDEIYLISAVSQELIRSLKHNAYIEALTFSHDSKQLFCYSIQGEVTVWNLTTFRVEKKFSDSGCVNASCITTSACGKLLATGSREGIINIYETTKFNSSNPIPVKTVSNLTTKITKLRFNATTEILAATSALLENAVKLIHIPSYHIFTNFPDQSINLSHVQTVTFSPNSGYMAMGNDKGRATLYRLKYYENY
ncbi:hypothetical protein ACJJTC_008284 [Scirpophaga incertulas]